MAAAGCGSSEEAEPTPEEVRQNLIDEGYQVGELLTKGAPEGVVNGQDADAYLSIDASPTGERLYSSVYFLPDEELARTLWRQFSKGGGGDTAVELRGTRVYHIAGELPALIAAVSAAEG